MAPLTRSNACGLLIAGTLSLFLQSSLAAQDQRIARTEHGQPDMQGVWFYGSNTPFERPVALGTQQSFTEAEGLDAANAVLAAKLQNEEPVDPDRGAPAAGAGIGQQADHNFSSFRTNLVRIDGLYRTSQIVSPANGRFPFREGGRDFFDQWLDRGYGAFDGPEVRPASERCAGPNGGPAAPMIGWFYNANMQIVQTADYFILIAEMNQDTRIIHLNRQQAPSEYPQWMGHSIGHWEGDTLVVETSQFRPEQSWIAFRMSGQLQVKERFTLISEDEILYSYTFTDPEIYTEPVTVEKSIVRRAPGERLYEYSCHEGNYSLPGILAGARRLEQEADD